MLLFIFLVWFVAFSFQGGLLLCALFDSYASSAINYANLVSVCVVSLLFSLVSSRYVFFRFDCVCFVLVVCWFVSLCFRCYCLFACVSRSFFSFLVVQYKKRENVNLALTTASTQWCVCFKNYCCCCCHTLLFFVFLSSCCWSSAAVITELHLMFLVFLLIFIVCFFFCCRGVPLLLDVEDLSVDEVPDALTVITYLALCFHQIHKSAQCS